MGYTFSGVASDSSSGNVSSVTLNIGPTPSPFVVVAALSTTGSQDSGLGAALGISVAAGNYMFASARLGGTAIFTGTVAPNGQRVTGGAVNDSSADWAILANNPSFSITNSQGNAWNAVAATYAVASSAAAFSYISASYIQ